MNDKNLVNKVDTLDKCKFINFVGNRTHTKFQLTFFHKIFQLTKKKIQALKPEL